MSSGVTGDGAGAAAAAEASTNERATRAETWRDMAAIPVGMRGPLESVGGRTSQVEGEKHTRQANRQEQQRRGHHRRSGVVSGALEHVVSPERGRSAVIPGSDATQA